MRRERLSVPLDWEIMGRVRTTGPCRRLVFPSRGRVCTWKRVFAVHRVDERG